MNKKAARKKELKKLKEKAKTAKRNSGRRGLIPPNKVIPDKKKKTGRLSLDEIIDIWGA